MPTSTTLEGRMHDPRPRSEALKATVALVTGGGRGIGQIVALALAEAGAAVALVSRSVDELNRTDRAALGGRPDRLVGDDGREPARPRPQQPTGAAHDGGAATRPDHQHDQPGRRSSLAPRVGVFRLQGRGRQAHREPRSRDRARYGIGVFSVHPGLLPIGLSTTVTNASPSTRHERRIREWTLNELSEGRGARPADAVELIMRSAVGDGDSLSGRHLSVHDDLDSVLAHGNAGCAPATSTCSDPRGSMTTLCLSDTHRARRRARRGSPTGRRSTSSNAGPRRASAARIIAVERFDVVDRLRPTCRSHGRWRRSRWSR